jgi:cobalt-precorrin 5A hydrolase
MECDQVRVAGFGFREAATVASLRDALAAAGGADGVVALATADTIIAMPSLQAFAEQLALPIKGVSAAALAAADTLTTSKRVASLFGTGSVAEAAALAAAGPGASLIGPRKVSSDGLATAAIAEGAQR